MNFTAFFYPAIITQDFQPKTAWGQPMTPQQQRLDGDEQNYCYRQTHANTKLWA
jgi:hypothetical protein